MNNVRLTPFEIAAIAEVAKHILGNALAAVRLYGSRTDLSKRGGDIDLAVEVFGSIDDRFNVIQSLREGLCARLGDQKIDLLIVSVDPALNTERENTFYSLILEGSKVLWSAHG